MSASSAKFSILASLTVLAYQKGLWTERVSIEPDEGCWRGRRVGRDPWTFKEQALAALTMSFRGRGELEVTFEDSSRMVWESPTRLIRVTPGGQRITHQSRLPILQFLPALLAANSSVMKAYLQEMHDDTFDVAALEDGKLIEYHFVRGEQFSVRVGERSKDVWRWAGAKRSYPKMFPQANLTHTAPFDILLARDGELLGWIDPVQDGVTVAQGFETLSTVACWRREDVSAPRFTTVTLAEKLMVPMSDWLRLAATIMVPGNAEGYALPGPFPTVLIRTPYGRKLSLGDAFKFVSRGYVVVSQDVRGRGDSDGSFHPIHDDIRDGDDTLNWIAAQPWSNGQVGMLGASYLAWTQWQAACSGNPHLKALISIVPMFSACGDLPYINGMFYAGMLTWAIFMNCSPERTAEAMNKDLNAVVSELPLIDADIRAVGHEIPFWRYWVTHAAMDSYWQPGNIYNHQHKIDLPVLHIVGWYDDSLRGTMAAFEMMTANQRANQQLLVGPWPHHINTTRSLAELCFGPDSCRADLHYRLVRWFDRWLKGFDNRVEEDGPIDYFTMGQNKWHATDRWPPPHTKRQKWYLHPGNDAASERRGRLSAMAPTEQVQQPHCYAHDPGNPVPYLVDIRANQLSVPEDYQELERRSDLLIYSTDVFEKPFEITGDATAVLYAATDQKDTDWVVRVTDVFPDGRSINLIDGYLRARFRDGMEKERLLTPGEVIQYRIPMTWTSYRFAAGHRMRVIIASAAAGAFVVNTNTGNPMGTDTETRIARQCIYHGAQYPSHIELSVSPAV